MTATTNIEERIALLLRKAESTTPEEAEALTEHAERLMLRYGIEQARIQARMSDKDIKPERIIRKNISLPTGHFGLTYAMVFNAIVDAYGGMQCYRAKTAYGTSNMVLVGFESDVLSVETLATSILLQGRTAMERWWEFARHWHTGMASATVGKARRDFLVGFGCGAAEKLKALRAQVHREAEAEEPGTALAVIDRSKAVDNYMTQNKIKVRHIKRAVNIDSAHAGAREGRKANVGGTSIGNGQRALPGGN